MTVSSPVPDAQSAIAIMLIDDDIIFRTGFRVWLTQQDGVMVVGEADRERSAIALIESALADAPASDGLAPPLVAVVGLTLNASPDRPYGGLQLCRRLRDRAPSVPLLLLGNPVNPSVIEQMQQAGAQGYGLKSENPNDLVQRLRQLAAGETVWPIDSLDAISSRERQSLRQPQRRITPLALLKRNARISGTRQINAVLADLLAQLDNPELMGIDRLVVEGRCRELRVARWMVQQILSTTELDASFEDEPAAVNPSTSRSLQAGQQPSSPPRPLPQPNPYPSLSGGLEGSAIISAGVEATLFDGVTLKLQSSLQNFSDVPLELDILREDKKRELLYLVLRKLMDLLNILRQSQVTPRQLQERRSPILRDLWQSIADTYFGKYYAVQVESLEVEVVTVLKEDANLAQAAILDRIPYVHDLLSHLLFQDPLVVDSVPHGPGTPEAMIRAEILLDHFIIQVANSIIQPLLNRLGDVEVIKQGFYDRSLMSSREIAQFRNNLSWRYRFERSIGEPVNIFESRYRLFVLQGNGIKKTMIYAPRRNELEALQGFPFLVTLVLEFRDAVAPRVRAVISFVGSGLIYVLTEIVGRGIGLVVRGIIKGIGSAWQDARFSRDASQRRL